MSFVDWFVDDGGPWPPINSFMLDGGRVWQVSSLSFDVASKRVGIHWLRRFDLTRDDIYDY